MKSLVLAAAIVAMLPGTALAQAVVMASPNGAMLRSGTPIVLRLAQTVTTRDKSARVNDRIRFEVAEPVKVNDLVVIPAGSPAVGELTTVQNKGMFGKAGRFTGRLLSVDANGRTIRLNGNFDSKGGSGTGAAVATTALVFAPAGFFMTGKSAEMVAGAVVRGFVDEDVPFSVAAPPQGRPNAK